MLLQKKKKKQYKARSGKILRIAVVPAKACNGGPRHAGGRVDCGGATAQYGVMVSVLAGIGTFTSRAVQIAALVTSNVSCLYFFL